MGKHTEDTNCEHGVAKEYVAVGGCGKCYVKSNTTEATDDEPKHVWVWESGGRSVYGSKLVPYRHNGPNGNILVDKACSCGLVSTFACYTYLLDGELNKDYSTSEEVCPRSRP